MKTKEERTAYYLKKKAPKKKSTLYRVKTKSTPYVRQKENYNEYL